MKLMRLAGRLLALGAGVAALAPSPAVAATATPFKAYAKVNVNCDYQYPPWANGTADANAAYFSDGCSDNNVTASGWAYANFGTGSMHGFASGVQGPGGSTGWGVGAGVGAMAQLMDDVWLVGSGTGGVVSFSLAYSGSFIGSIGYRSLGATLMLNNQYFHEDCSQDACSGTLTGSISVAAGNHFSLMAATGVSVVSYGPPIAGDFSHTATLSFTTPAGYTLYDANGPVVFAPVPEPAPGSMLALGCLALAGLRWRRVQRAAASSAR